MNIRGKNVLIIGSGCDMKGRRAAAFIDSFDGVVIRCNRPYQSAQDGGKRCDLWFTRWRSWLGNITPQDGEHIIINDCDGITQNELEIMAQELGHEYISCGLVAVMYCLHRGAKSISVMGFGYSPASRGFFPKAYQSRYPEKAGLPVTKYQVDRNPVYNWTLENAFLLNNHINLL